MRLKYVVVISLMLTGAAFAQQPPADPDIALSLSQLNQIIEIYAQQKKADDAQEALQTLNLKYAGAVQRLNSQLRPVAAAAKPGTDLPPQPGLDTNPPPPARGGAPAQSGHN